MSTRTAPVPLLRLSPSSSTSTVKTTNTKNRNLPPSSTMSTLPSTLPSSLPPPVNKIGPSRAPAYATDDSSSDDEDDAHTSSPRTKPPRSLPSIAPQTIAPPQTTSYLNAPLNPLVSKPMWQQQQESRTQSIRKQMVLQTTDAARHKASLNGTLVGHRLSRPLVRKKGRATLRRNVVAVTPETLQKCLYIADDIISCADQGTVDRAISVNEMKIFLKATKYEDFMVWLTGVNSETKKSRFHEIDEDDSQSIEIDELAAALREYFETRATVDEFYAVAQINQQRYKDEKARKKEEHVKADVKKKREAVELKEREDKRRLLNAQALVSGDHEKLNRIRHRLLAASYTSFGFSSDFDVMFKKFDKDGNGTLDCEELKGVVRRHLHISPASVSDFELETLFAFLDVDNGGTIEQDELVEFLKHDQVEGQPIALPMHLQHIGTRTHLEELTDLINFKTVVEKEDEAKVPQAPPGEIPWVHSTKSPRMATTYQTTGIGVTFHNPQNY